MVRFRDITVSRLSSGTILWIEEAGEIKTGTMTYDNAIPRVPRERNSIFVAVPTRNVDCVPAISASEGKIYLFISFFFFWKENRNTDERWTKVNFVLFYWSSKMLTMEIIIFVGLY